MVAGGGKQDGERIGKTREEQILPEQHHTQDPLHDTRVGAPGCWGDGGERLEGGKEIHRAEDKDDHLSAVRGSCEQQ